MALIETVIALALVFAILSIITTALKEMIEAWVQKRKKDLKGAIEDLLSVEGAEEFLKDPRIQAINAATGTHWFDRNKWPSYIEPSTFAAVAQSLLSTFPDTNLAKAVTATTAILVPASIQSLYEQRMDRLIGGFKRNAQQWLIFLGTILAIAVDADSLYVARQLSVDGTTRTAMVALSEKIKTPEDVGKYCDNEEVRGDLNQAAIQKLTHCTATFAPTILGWTKQRQIEVKKWFSGDFTEHLLEILLAAFGYLITGLAISLGASFWFDLIGRVANIRSTMKKEK